MGIRTFVYIHEFKSPREFMWEIFGVKLTKEVITRIYSMEGSMLNFVKKLIDKGLAPGIQVYKTLEDMLKAYEKMFQRKYNVPDAVMDFVDIKEYIRFLVEDIATIDITKLDDGYVVVDNEGSNYCTFNVDEIMKYIKDMYY